MEFSQKSGCFCALRLRFLCHRALSNGDLSHTRDLQDLPAKLCEKRWIISRISCDFLRIFLLRIFNISQKVAKFDIESDFQMSSFSSNPDKNNRTRKIGLSHPGNFPFCRVAQIDGIDSRCVIDDGLFFRLLFLRRVLSPLRRTLFLSFSFRGTGSRSQGVTDHYFVFGYF